MRVGLLMDKNLPSPSVGIQIIIPVGISNLGIYTDNKLAMDSVMTEKRKLYDTLLSFPPFYTYIASHSAYRSTKSRGGNR